MTRHLGSSFYKCTLLFTGRFITLNLQLKQNISAVFFSARQHAALGRPRPALAQQVLKTVSIPGTHRPSRTARYTIIEKLKVH